MLQTPSQTDKSTCIGHIWKKSEKTNETIPRNACYKHPDKQTSEIIYIGLIWLESGVQ